MNQITRQLEVCCNQVESLDYPTSTDTTAVLSADGSESADFIESADLSESADYELETSESVSSANLVLPGSVLPATQGLVNSPNQVIDFNLQIFMIWICTPPFLNYHKRFKVFKQTF